MYLSATDNGIPTTLVAVPERTADGKDVRLLPLMIEAARIAESEEFCYQYDRIASLIGTWTRDELREAGLLDSDYRIEGTRTLTVTVTLPFAYTGTFSSEGDARESDPCDYLGDIEREDLLDAIRYHSWDVTNDDHDIESVARDY